MGLDMLAYRSPRDMFSQRAWPKLAPNVEASPQIILQQLKGWERLFEATEQNPKSTRSPFWWSGADNPLTALDTWSREQEMSALSIYSDEGYAVGLHLEMEILLLRTLATSATIQGVSIREILALDSEAPQDSPTSPLELLRKTRKEILLKTGMVEGSGVEDIVVYSAPRFFPVHLQERIEELIASVVIDPSRPVPQNGLGYKFSPEMVQEMFWGFSSKLITLEVNNKIDGIYCLHLSFPAEPTMGMSEVRSRAIELNLISDPSKFKRVFARELPFQSESKKTAWVDLIAISEDARKHYRAQGVHVYSAVHDTMKEMCHLYGVQRLCALVRVGDNENLAWQSHKRLGWQMPQELYQRQNPIISHGNEYALIYLDI